MTLGIGNLTGNLMKPGSMGKPTPGYHLDLVDADGNPVADGENGESMRITPHLKATKVWNVLEGGKIDGEV